MKRHSPGPGPFSVFLWLVARVMNSAATPLNWGWAHRSACTVDSAVVFNVIAHFQRFLLGATSSSPFKTNDRSDHRKVFAICLTVLDQFALFVLCYGHFIHPKWLESLNIALTYILETHVRSSACLSSYIFICKRITYCKNTESDD